MRAETAVVSRVQGAIARRPVVAAARGLSEFGEHSRGWVALGLLGAVVDRNRRREWVLAAGGVFAAHVASVAVKQLVRRPRPHATSVEVLVGTPSSLSFPSAHATSTTAAAVLYSGLTGRRLEPLLVPPMLLSRLVLGVHYPSDVLVGSAIGGLLGGLLRRRLGSSRPARGGPRRSESR